MRLFVVLEAASMLCCGGDVSTRDESKPFRNGVMEVASALCDGGRGGVGGSGAQQQDVWHL